MTSSFCQSFANNIVMDSKKLSESEREGCCDNQSKTDLSIIDDIARDSLYPYSVQNDDDTVTSCEIEVILKDWEIE